MDDDFNSREAVAKVLGMVREISKVLATEMEAADRNAFAHYAVDLLEETAGASCVCLHRMWRWPSLKRTRGKQNADEAKRCCFNVMRQMNKDWSLTKSETNSTPWAWWSLILLRAQSGTLRDPRSHLQEAPSVVEPEQRRWLPWQRLRRPTFSRLNFSSQGLTAAGDKVKRDQHDGNKADERHQCLVFNIVFFGLRGVNGCVDVACVA